MKKVITMLLLCIAATAAIAQSTTTIVMPDGTMMVCTNFGTVTTCEKI